MFSKAFSCVFLAAFICVWAGSHTAAQAKAPKKTGTLDVEISIKGTHSMGNPDQGPSQSTTVDRLFVVQYELEMIERGIRNYLDPNALPLPEPEPIQIPKQDPKIAAAAADMMAACEAAGDQDAKFQCMMEKALAASGKDMKFLETCTKNPTLPECGGNEEESVTTRRPKPETPYESWMTKGCSKGVATIKDHGHGMKFHPADTYFIPYSFEYDATDDFKSPQRYKKESFCGARMVVDTVGKTASISLESLGFEVVLRQPTDGRKTPGPNDRERFFGMSTIKLDPRNRGFVMVKQPLDGTIHSFQGQSAFKDENSKSEQYRTVTTVKYKFTER